MAAMRNLSKNFMFGRISNPISSLLSSSSPAILVSCRGVASKLFVGAPNYPLYKRLIVGILGSTLDETTLESPKVREVEVSTDIHRRYETNGLSYHTTEEGLSEAFSQCGQVIEATIVMDRVSDRSKGFGFVSYASETEAEKAITEMNGKALNGRTIFVDYAKPRSGYGGGMPIARGPPETALDN